jgi:hypothetical protein
MGALEMQNLSVLDNRAFLLHHLDVSRHLTAKPAPPELTEIFGAGDGIPPTPRG